MEQPQFVEQPHIVQQPHTVEQPKDVEQAQRCGTGPKMWNKGKISNAGTYCKKTGVAKDVEHNLWNTICGIYVYVEQVFDVEKLEHVEQPKDVEQAQRGGIAVIIIMFSLFYGVIIFLNLGSPNY